MTSRNVFENNTPNPGEEDAKVVGDGPHVLLPPLDADHHYELIKLPSGRSAVTVEENRESSRPKIQITTNETDRDEFGRRKL